MSEHNNNIINDFIRNIIRDNIEATNNFIKYMSNLHVGDIIKATVHQKLIELVIVSISDINMTRNSNSCKLNVIGYMDYDELIFIRTDGAAKDHLFWVICLKSTTNDSSLLIDRDSIKINDKSVNEILGGHSHETKC